MCYIANSQFGLNWFNHGMKDFVGYYIYLILTLVGFITPVTGILLSIFQNGVDKLKAEYENKASRYDKGITGINEGDKGNVKQVKELRKELKSQEKRLKRSRFKVRIKLWVLQPRKQTVILFMLLVVSFLLANSYFLTLDENFYNGALNQNWLRYVLLIVSAVIFMVVLVDLYLLTGILIEVRKLAGVEQNKSVFNDEVANIDYECLRFHVNGKHINKKDGNETIIVTENSPLSPIFLYNSSDAHMLKNIKVGMKFLCGKLRLSSGDGNTEIRKDKSSSSVEWSIGELGSKDNIYMTSLKIEDCKVGELNVNTEICVDAEKVNKTFIIEIVPETSVENGVF